MPTPTTKDLLDWLKLRVPANVWMAQGIPPRPMPYDLPLPSIAIDVDDDTPIAFEMPTKPFRWWCG